MSIKEQILSLRSQNYSFNKIEETLDCSRGTISYHCSPNGKVASHLRSAKRRKISPLAVKIEKFRSRKSKKTHPQKPCERDKRVTEKGLRNKLGPTPRCYLTGDRIDLSKPSEYNLDHVISISRGGDNSLSNCEAATKIANLMKSDQSLPELHEECKKILRYSGDCEVIARSDLEKRCGEILTERGYEIRKKQCDSLIALINGY